MTAEHNPAPLISVVVPVHDESGAAVPLAREIAEAFAGRSFEMIFVDDASRDATLEAMYSRARPAMARVTEPHNIASVLAIPASDDSRKVVPMMAPPRKPTRDPNKAAPAQATAQAASMAPSSDGIR